MDTYWKALSAAIMSIILCLSLSKNAKDYATLIVILLCTLFCAVTAAFFVPVLDVMDKLSAFSSTGSAWLEILLKCVGLSFIGETVTLICTDSGYGAIGKGIQILTSVVILWVSLPMIEKLLDLILDILEML